MSDLPIILFENPAAWTDWLEAQHASVTGIWLKLAKAGAKIPSITYAEALEVALCYGWIDGQKKGLDERFWLQKFTPVAPKAFGQKSTAKKPRR